jgi:hypothetical protein
MRFHHERTPRPLGAARGAGMLVGFLALAGCTASSTGANPNGGDAGTMMTRDAGAGGAPLGCLGVFTCVNNSNCSTDACVNGCLAQGSPDAQKQVTDLATCYQNASCTDSACLKANCEPQLDACVAGSAPAPTGTDLEGGSGPPGSVPADFVGTWMAGDSFDLGATQELQFNADGTGLYAQSFSGSLGQCASTIVTKYEGTVVIDAGAATITVYATTVTESTSACGAPTTMTKPAKTLSFTYQPDNLNDGGISVVDSVCASQYTAQPDINLYCTYLYRKQ